MFAFMDEKEEIFTLSKDEFTQKFNEGEINQESLIFDPLVKTKGEFLEKWIIPVKESWHKQFT